jgi:hypothetical protein
MQRKLLGIINVDFDAAGQLLIIYILHLSNTSVKMGIQESSVLALYRLQESL